MQFDDKLDLMIQLHFPIIVQKHV